MTMRALFLSLAFVAAALPAAAQIDRAPKVAARLVAETPSLRPGGAVTVALEQVIRPRWHTYWKNPGAVGAPTTLEWRLPPGWKAGPIQWPFPSRLPVGPLMDYGYTGTVWLLTGIAAPENAAPGPVTLRAHATWLVCEQICVPEERDLAATVTVSNAPAAPSPSLRGAFADARARLPAPSPWPARFALHDGAANLYLAAPRLASARPVAAAFFPDAPHLIDDAARQSFAFADDGIVLRLAPGDALRRDGALPGVLVLTSSDGSRQAVELRAMPGAVPIVDFPVSDGLTWWLALGFALLGGIILNIMPCVLPVLAMKALSLAGANRRRDGASYAAGAILGFLGLGLAVVLARQAGLSLGWGFQLQSPLMVACFALLMAAVGLSLAGVFEVNAFSRGDALTARGGWLGSFFTGLLAVGVAAPCTAPFMAAAIGFAILQSAPLAMAVFFMLGLGFAAPFLLLSLWPALTNLLPRPGAWMARLKQILALPMFATGAWLLWVLARQSGTQASLFAAAAIAVLAAGAITWTRTRPASTRARGIGAFVLCVSFVAALSLVWLAGRVPAAASAPMAQNAYTPARLETLREQGRGVFVNATASWCITCVVNEEAVLSRDSVRRALADRGIVYLVADWTRQDAAVTALLVAHGRAGVPLYLYYPPRAAVPVILPQLLTVDAVLAALNQPQQEELNRR